MTLMKIAEGRLEGTRFADNVDLVALLKKHLAASGEAHLFDGGSDFDYRVSPDRHCEVRSYGEHWLVVSFFDFPEHPEWMRFVRPK